MPEPAILDELAEALDGLELAWRDLHEARRAVLPAVNAYRRATKRVRDVWRHYRTGRDLPILDGARNGNGQAKAAEVVEGLPDGGKPVARRRARQRPGGYVPADGQWTEPAILEASRLLGADWMALCVCNRCHAARLLATQPCPGCESPEYSLVGGILGGRYLDRLGAGRGKFPARAKKGKAHRSKPSK